MIELTRFGQFKDKTIGRLKYDGAEFWTIERPWLDNKTNVSCIPDGYYKLRRHDSPKFGDGMWEIVNVPNRTYILIHVGNFSHDVLGCLALGSGVSPDLSSVTRSRDAIDKFYRLTEGLDEEEIVINTRVLM